MPRLMFLCTPTHPLRAAASLLAAALTSLLVASSTAQTPPNPTTPVNVFDNYPAQYEAVFSTLDDGYLTTGLLAERAYPIFPMQNRLGDLPYHDTLVTNGQDFDFGAAMVRHMSESPGNLGWLDDDYVSIEPALAARHTATDSSTATTIPVLKARSGLRPMVTVNAADANSGDGRGGICDLRGHNPRSECHQRGNLSSLVA